MYNDNRAIEEAKDINVVAKAHCARHGYQFAASFGLSKVLWLQRKHPEIWKKTSKIIHSADFIVGKLTGEFSISDYSNALKTGYDLLDLRWPSFITKELNLPEILSTTGVLELFNVMFTREEFFDFVNEIIQKRVE